jgi:hypothetical protein
MKKQIEVFGGGKRDGERDDQGDCRREVGDEPSAPLAHRTGSRDTINRSVRLR